MASHHDFSPVLPILYTILILSKELDFDINLIKGRFTATHLDKARDVFVVNFTLYLSFDKVFLFGKDFIRTTTLNKNVHNLATVIQQ